MLLRDQALAAEIRQTVTTTASNLNAIVTDLKDGRGPAGMLLRDEELSGRIRSAVKNAERATADLSHASHQADALVSGLNSREIPQKASDVIDSISDSARQVHQAVSDILKPNADGVSATENISESLANANVATSNLAEATEALKHNFLVRGFFKKRGYYSLGDLSPEQYRRDPVFTRVSNGRLWLSGSLLFEDGSNGDQMLSARGKQILNAALEEYGDSIIANPVVIEGYSDGQIPTDQARLSRARAMAIRHYLQSRFQLDEKNVGIVALKNSPPDGLGRRTWDGVCIVVLRKN
jgi:phospholipid/cholesterol/gamma-HCH transport system substrate-binding protein